MGALTSSRMALVLAANPPPVKRGRGRPKKFTPLRRTLLGGIQLHKDGSATIDGVRHVRDSRGWLQPKPKRAIGARGSQYPDSVIQVLRAEVGKRRAAAARTGKRLSVLKAIEGWLKEIRLERRAVEREGAKGQRLSREAFARRAALWARQDAAARGYETKRAAALKRLLARRVRGS